MPSPIYLYEGDANVGLSAVAPGSVSLVVTSPRYLDLIDYEAVARGRALKWRDGDQRESLDTYVREHMETCRQLADVCAHDATICIEVDYYRDTAGRCLLPLPDLFRDMLAGCGFRVADQVTLARHLAHGRRSGHFIKSAGKPGTLLPDNLTSVLIIAQRGDANKRLRHGARPQDHLDVEAHRRFLVNLWRISPPGKRILPANHPVPMDGDVVRTLIRAFSLPGDTVVDCWAGSGTVGRIASSLDRESVLIERVPRFAAYMREKLGAQPLARRPRPLIVQGGQIALPLGVPALSAMRRAFAEKSIGGVTPRMRAIARRVQAEAGVEVPPELMALVLRASRAYWVHGDTKAAA
ncbi:MAG: DNA methyltransferase [Gemmatimonadaceae bacterium]